MDVCANPATLSGVIGSQRKSFSQSLEIIDDIPCANLIFLFFAMHGNIRLFSRSRTMIEGSRIVPALFAATAANSTALLPSDAPRLTVNQTGRVFLKTCHASRPSQAGTWPQPPPRPPSPRRNFPPPHFPQKKRKSRKPVP